ncbi:hypothetical protein SAMN05216275_10510 [Streptosporangium canum]|uniref:Uncharacterized protein n=1 Tax=Streptosporangium canum TaxID=324952 RepID=A0A1I3L4F5_9ACTN|nr:hypothetical protein [Streptosporangium canum]SFI79571.1 hypothetical protein SAMN05216275_10510 [Streptosporangium canum]
MKQTKYYESKPPTDLSRPPVKEPKPINPVIMIALGKALFLR